MATSASVTFGKGRGRGLVFWPSWKRNQPRAPNLAATSPAPGFSERNWPPILTNTTSREGLGGGQEQPPVVRCLAAWLLYHVQVWPAHNTHTTNDATACQHAPRPTSQLGTPRAPPLLPWDPEMKS